MTASNEKITAVCTASIYTAGDVRMRMRACGIKWSETRKWFKVYFIATGTREQWRREREMGGNSRLLV